MLSKHVVEKDVTLMDIALAIYLNAAVGAWTCTGSTEEISEGQPRPRITHKASISIEARPPSGDTRRWRYNEEFVSNGQTSIGVFNLGVSGGNLLFGLGDDLTKIDLIDSTVTTLNYHWQVHQGNTIDIYVFEELYSAAQLNRLEIGRIGGRLWYSRQIYCHRS